MAMVQMSSEVDRVRSFNRFYTRRIGVLDEAHLDSGFTLTEARLIYELAQSGAATAKALRHSLDLDAGYVSRMLRRLESAGLLARSVDPDDGRSARICLTDQGLGLFRRLNRRSQAQVEAMLEPLSPEQRETVAGAMGIIRNALDRKTPQAPIVLRTHRSGDMGWVIARHAALYGQEYGWGERMEALVARVCADFIEGFNPARDRCWIAERDGERLGSIFLVDGGDGVARLRLLLVEPAARGSGLGRRLAAECIGFAREAGYREITLWTHSVLTAARRIYAEAGFQLVATEPHNRFGPMVVGETWTLEF